MQRVTWINRPFVHAVGNSKKFLTLRRVRARAHQKSADLLLSDMTSFSGDFITIWIGIMIGDGSWRQRHDLRFEGLHRAIDVLHNDFLCQTASHCLYMFATITVITVILFISSYRIYRIELCLNAIDYHWTPADTVGSVCSLPNGSSWIYSPDLASSQSEGRCAS